MMTLAEAIAHPYLAIETGFPLQLEDYDHHNVYACTAMGTIHSQVQQRFDDIFHQTAIVLWSEQSMPLQAYLQSRHVPMKTTPWFYFGDLLDTVTHLLSSEGLIQNEVVLATHEVYLLFQLSTFGIRDLPYILANHLKVFSPGGHSPYTIQEILNNNSRHGSEFLGSAFTPVSNNHPDTSFATPTQLPTDQPNAYSPATSSTASTSNPTTPTTSSTPPTPSNSTDDPPPQTPPSAAPPSVPFKAKTRTPLHRAACHNIYKRPSPTTQPRSSTPVDTTEPQVPSPHPQEASTTRTTTPGIHTPPPLAAEHATPHDSPASTSSAGHSNNHTLATIPTSLWPHPLARPFVRHQQSCYQQLQFRETRTISPALRRLFHQLPSTGQGVNFPFQEIKRLLAHYIDTRREAFINPSLPHTAHIDGDPLELVFGVKAFHRSQFLQLAHASCYPSANNLYAIKYPS